MGGVGDGRKGEPQAKSEPERMRNKALDRLNGDKWCQTIVLICLKFSLVDTLILRPEESESGNGQPDLTWVDGCFLWLLPISIIDSYKLPSRQTKT